MKLTFCHDTYYTQSPEGHVYSYGAFPYSLWQDRFLPHFDHITVIGREQPFDPLVDDCLEPSSGDNVDFKLLENINTPFKRIFCAKPLERAIEEQVKNSDTLIIRGPVEFGMIAAKAARKHEKPYAVEMSGCAFDHTWFHGSLIGKLYAPVKYLRARHMVKRADAVIYVTQHFLQSRYPNKNLSEFASNVEINPQLQSILKKRHKKIENQNGLTFGLIGNVNNHLKGLKVALKALSSIKHTLPKDFKLRILGQANPQKWEDDIKHYGLEDHIVFDGTLPGGDAVLKWLENIDIYIQPSYHEGLPRALIEAMSIGCPALASDAGGTAELLEPNLIHKKGDDKKLAQDIQKMLNTDIQIQQSSTNFETATRYTRDTLIKRRQKFWKKFTQTINVR